MLVGESMIKFTQSCWSPRKNLSDFFYASEFSKFHVEDFQQKDKMTKVKARFSQQKQDFPITQKEICCKNSPETPCDPKMFLKLQRPKKNDIRICDHPLLTTSFLKNKSHL